MQRTKKKKNFPQGVREELLIAAYLALTNFSPSVYIKVHFRNHMIVTLCHSSFMFAISPVSYFNLPMPSKRSYEAKWTSSKE